MHEYENKTHRAEQAWLQRIYTQSFLKVLLTVSQSGLHASTNRFACMDVLPMINSETLINGILPRWGQPDSASVLVRTEVVTV
jgi:hypothetical protein